MDYQKTVALALADEDAEIAPIPVDAGTPKPDIVLDRLSNIVAAFNEQYGTHFSDADRVARRIRDEIAPKVSDDPDYRNARENTPQNACQGWSLDPDQAR